jgi:hypothetical protein
LTVSIGFAVAETGEQADLKVLQDQAAAALSEAKQAGRNCAFVRFQRAYPVRITDTPATSGSPEEQGVIREADDAE